jgi:hypothetical protein
VIAVVDWSAVSALGTVWIAVVVAVTALFGFRQLRLARIQLEQLRRATQLDGAMKIFDNLHNRVYVEDRHFVATELPKYLEDPIFRNEVELGMIWTENPDTIHHEQFILRTFETIGSHVQRGLLDREVIVDTAAIPILLAWEHLSGVVELQRRTIHPRMWENFEKLHDAAAAWFVKRSSTEQYQAWRERVARYRGK